MTGNLLWIQVKRDCGELEERVNGSQADMMYTWYSGDSCIHRA